MVHNNISLGGAAVAIEGPYWYTSEILEGRYTVVLQHSTAGPPMAAAIGQTGQVPQDAESLTFYGRGGFTVTFAGQPIPLLAVGSTSAYTIFEGDIAAFANQTGELLFQGGGWLDAIQFSDQAIPEPSVLGLSALGALLLGWRALARRR